MYAVVSPAPGVLEVNYMWLPSWVGMNSTLLQEMGEAVKAAVVGKPLPEAEEAGHEAVISFLEERYPEMSGLRGYLEGMKLVRIDGEEPKK